MSYRIRFTPGAETDLIRLYEFILARDATDWAVAERALEAIKDDEQTVTILALRHQREDDYQ